MYRGWKTSYGPEKESLDAPLVFKTHIDGRVECKLMGGELGLSRKIKSIPTDDGVWLEMTVTSKQRISPGFCIQQCLRNTGAWNDPWRLDIAHIPYLSGLDM
jgi:hypothetical protein